MILVEADTSPEWDSSTDWHQLAEDAVRAAVRASRHGAMIDGALAVEVSVKFTSDEQVQTLNGQYRGKDKATNVLSFPMIEPELLDRLSAQGGGEVLLGDVVLAQGVCAREAAEKGIGTCAHAAHLLIHGTLHLLGYDHEEGDAEAEAMEAVERRALATLGIADPYPTEVRSPTDA